VFGAHRRELFAADLDPVDDRAARQRDAERERLRRTLDETVHRQGNILRQAQDREPDDPFAHGFRATYNDLEAERKTVAGRMAALEAAEEAEPDDVQSAGDADLLDALPHLSPNLSHAPQNLLRALFEIIQLNVRLHQDSEDVTTKITPPGDMLTDLAEAVERIETTMPALHRLPPRGEAAQGAEAVSAPNGIRTRATALKGRRPGPLDDEG
jgi:site-specific DNA recombinase